MIDISKNFKRQKIVRKICGKRLTAFIFLTATFLSALAPMAQAQSLVLIEDRAWINSVGTLLYADPDRDGFFSGVSLSIDADTRFRSLEVFAIIDITNELNDTERLLSTRSFYIYERSSTDEYHVDIDLVQNFFPGVYDLQISLIEAKNNRILDSVSARDFNNLRALPLESEDNTSPSSTPLDLGLQPPNDDIRVTEFAGGTGIPLIISLILLRILRFKLAAEFRKSVEKN